MGLLFGIVVGYFVGTMIAPRRGTETREMLSENARELLEASKRKAEQKAREIARATQEKAGQLGSEIGRKAAESAVKSVSDELLGQNKTA